MTERDKQKWGPVLHDTVCILSAFVFTIRERHDGAFGAILEGGSMGTKIINPDHGSLFDLSFAHGQ